MKKNVLLIFAYPTHDNLNYAIYEQIKKGLEEGGHQIKILDLYAEKFDPVLIFNQEQRRRDIQHRPETKRYREQILWANHLVFIFPIWWGGMPAILKGYIDKVFATGFAYHFEGVLPRGHLRGKTAWIITTDDTPAPVGFFMQDYGKVLKKQILSTMTGIKPTKHLKFTYVKGRKPETIKRWLAKCYQLGRNGL
ncbi:NAD(P)H dehydrogenase (quinone) [Clostridia bacterium]|nr:NAD(P)H dehydrogenase (quinone) [Clostridia bacterium]